MVSNSSSSQSTTSASNNKQQQVQQQTTPPVKSTTDYQTTKSFNFFVKDPKVKIYPTQPPEQQTTTGASKTTCVNNKQYIPQHGSQEASSNSSSSSPSDVQQHGTCTSIGHQIGFDSNNRSPQTTQATPDLSTPTGHPTNYQTASNLGKNSTTVQTRRVGEHHLSHWFLRKESNGESSKLDSKKGVTKPQKMSFVHSKPNRTCTVVSGEHALEIKNKQGKLHSTSQKPSPTLNQREGKATNHPHVQPGSSLRIEHQASEYFTNQQHGYYQPSTHHYPYEPVPYEPTPTHPSSVIHMHAADHVRFSPPTHPSPHQHHGYLEPGQPIQDQLHKTVPPLHLSSMHHANYETSISHFNGVNHHTHVHHTFSNHHTHAQRVTNTQQRVYANYRTSDLGLHANIYGRATSAANLLMPSSESKFEYHPKLPAISSLLNDKPVQE